MSIRVPRVSLEMLGLMELEEPKAIRVLKARQAHWDGKVL